MRMAMASCSSSKESQRQCYFDRLGVVTGRVLVVHQRQWLDSSTNHAGVGEFCFGKSVWFPDLCFGLHDSPSVSLSSNARDDDRYIFIRSRAGYCLRFDCQQPVFHDCLFHRTFFRQWIFTKRGRDQHRRQVCQTPARRWISNNPSFTLYFLPYDLVSYFSGFLRIDLGWFMLATVLGSIPGTISFGMLGASIQGDFASQSVSLDPRALGLSALMFGFSILMYRIVRKREVMRN